MAGYFTASTFSGLTQNHSRPVFGHSLSIRPKTRVDLGDLFHDKDAYLLSTQALEPVSASL